jgi:alcohol dehydrogenase YqhD (iron-dependent ADH family)
LSVRRNPVADRLSKFGANTVDVTRRTNVKLMAAVIGGSAVVAMGALTMAVTEEHAAPATITSSGMTVGATSTLETPPAEPETTIAVPAVKAQPFGGSGS